ncbi:MAG: GH3 auxin-responsive promoter family protein [Chloroflexi bacterium]|nr:GH3 auxin-responsive promoter family protein [Chloroflexota bacterium]
MNAALANRLWLFASRKAARDFETASHHVEETQAHILQKYLAKNHNTEYVNRSIGTQGSSACHLPLTTYDDYIPYIERIADGEKNVLTRDPVQLFELSSGSTSASKMIPYTRTLKREFGFALSAWITDLYTHHPDLMTGPAYWSISPLTDGRRRTSAGIPIGFEDDSEYLGPLGWLIESALAVPNTVKQIRDMAAFRYVTLLFLLNCKDLRLISVWNPTFFTLLLAPLPQWWDSLLRDLAGGTLTSPAGIDNRLLHSLAGKLAPNSERARELSSVKPHDYASIWKHLRLISCWADGASEIYARELQDGFPGVVIQPKGLLATEAFVSFPLIGKTGGALAVTSHYFEFQNEDGDIFPAHQLERGEAYSVIVTTGGGLYRYELRDVVEVTDFYNEVPCFKFIGKADKVSDYFGEKLNERFVADVLERLFKRHQFFPNFFLLAPDDEGGFRYTLYIEVSRLPDGFAAELDASLRENFHYDYCRKLGQLAEARAVLVNDGAGAYVRVCQQMGLRMGDIKASALQKTTGWGARFQVRQ